MRLVDWDVILMHYRNWFHYPHDAGIIELEPPALATCVLVRPEPPRSKDAREGPSALVELAVETIELSYHAWRFADHAYQLWVGYGPRSNTLVWRPDAS